LFIVAGIGAMSERVGFIAVGRGARVLSLERGLTDAPASVDVLYAKYCAAHARWHHTKLQSDQIAARKTYRKRVVAFLGEADAEPVLALAPPAWGPL
jgi:hypothetical protein